MNLRSTARRATAAIAGLLVSELDSRAFRTAVLDVLRGVLGFDWYVWVLTDPATEVGVDPLAEVPDLTELTRLIRLKYVTPLNRWTGLDAVSSLGERQADSLVWREAQSRHGVRDVASVVMRDGFGCWAFLDLWSRHPMETSSLDLLAQLAPDLTGALRQRAAATFATPADALPADASAAVLLLDDDLQLLGRTPTSQALLSQLLPASPGRDPIPAAALNVAAQLLAQEQGVDAHTAEARVHLAHGLWVTLKASRVPPSTLIAVTMEPSTPAERLDMYARSNGLSPRERELVSLLAEGHPTSDIAARMFVSEHTVQDHLKSVFAKTNTHSRRTLLAHALGVKTTRPTAP